MTGNTLNKRRSLLITISVVGVLALALFGLISVSMAASPDSPLARPLALLGESSLGDYVWHDVDHDGIQDVSETGINGVLVNLYLDANGNQVIDAGEYTSTIPTKLNLDPPHNDGWYDFVGITADGNRYIVEIDPSNFLSGGALENYVYTGDLGGQPYSGPEPRPVHLWDIIMDYNNADFGYALAGIELVKLAGDAPDGDVEYIEVPSETVTYTYTFTNTGETYLSNVVITDDNGTPGFAGDDFQPCAPFPGPYAPGTGDQCQWSTVVSDNRTNIATVVGNPTDDQGTDLPGNDVTDDDDAVVKMVDARITLDPLQATNEVGDPHVVTAMVEVHDGTSWGPAPDGTTVTFSLQNNTAGASFVGGNSCVTSGGSCSVTISASSGGSVDIHAQTTVSVGDLQLQRSTGVSAGSSGDAEKTYVDARITLDPLQATNEVGDPHVITATVEVHNGTSWGMAADGTMVVFSLLNNTAGASFVGGNSCVTSGGSCSVTINASSGGSVDIHAQTTVSVGGLFLQRSTGVSAGSSADAEKTYVDARITLDPLQATNEVGDPHVVTATVEVYNGTSWGPAPDGTTVTFSLQNNTAGASFVGGVNSCVTSSGSCSVTINAGSGGSVDIHAQTTVSVGGLQLQRSTGVSAGSSADAEKTYVEARLKLTPPEDVNQVGEDHVFTALLEIDDGDGSFDPAAGETISFTIDSGPGNLSSPTCVTGGVGTCTVTLTSTVTGTTQVSAEWLGQIATASGSASASADDDAEKLWVDPRITITKRLNTVEPVRVDEPLSFTIRITNTGDITIAILPLTDVYSTTYLTYGYTDTTVFPNVSSWADPDSDDNNHDGEIDWSNLTVSFGQDLAPNASFTVIVTFTAKVDTHNVGLLNDETENTAIVDSALADPDGAGPLPPDKPVPPVQDSDYVKIIFPTGVVLARFEAAAQPDGVVVAWETASELDILGFNLLRSDAGGDGSTELTEVFVAVNDAFIFAEYAGADFGASYGYLDAALPPGIYAYTLEVVKLDGNVERYGLAEVDVG